MNKPTPVGNVNAGCWSSTQAEIAFYYIAWCAPVHLSAKAFELDVDPCTEVYVCCTNEHQRDASDLLHQYLQPKGHRKGMTFKTLVSNVEDNWHAASRSYANRSG